MQLSRYIDHTLLKPEASLAQIEKLCAEAKEHRFYSVCVNTSFAATCAALLEGSDVKVCCVVGFPLGAMDSESKGFETRTAVKNGAQEIDMVIHVGALKEGRLDYVRNDIAEVVKAAAGVPVKVIIETSLLSDSEKVAACKAAMEAKAHFVKTSTGFNGGGATVADVQLMKSVVGEALQVKASGGVKDATQAQAMIAAGASRLGTSSGVLIVQGGTATGGY